MDLRLDANITDSFITQNRSTFDENSTFGFIDERQQQHQLNQELNDNYFFNYTNLSSPVYPPSHHHHHSITHQHQSYHHQQPQHQHQPSFSSNHHTQSSLSSIACWSSESNYAYSNAMINYNHSPVSTSSTPSPSTNESQSFVDIKSNTVMPLTKVAAATSNANQVLHQQSSITPVYFTDDSQVQYTTHIIGGRIVKRRVTANKKERRRTLSINSAFSNLRDRIPNVPADTKLSKIKTLRLATSYISYLMNLLDENHAVGRKTQLLSCEDFKVDLQRFKGGHKLVDGNSMKSTSEYKDKIDEGLRMTKKSKGRTGWPQHVWRNELQQQDYNEA